MEPRNRVFVTVLMGITAGMLFWGCSDLTSPSKKSNNPASGRGSSFSNLSGDIFIDLPGSVAPERQGLGKQRVDVDESDAIAVYNGVREYIALADELVHNPEWGVKAIILFWRDTLNWRYIMEIGRLTGQENGFQWEASYDASRTYAYRLVIRSLIEPGSPIGLKVEFNGDFEAPAGRAYYNVVLFEPAETTRPEVEVTFSKTGLERALDVTIISESVGGDDPDGPQNIELRLRERDGIIHMGGGSWHPDIDSILKDVTGYCYVFEGTVDTAADKAVVWLGLPPATCDETGDALFTDYGIAAMFSRALINYEIPELNDTIKRVIVTSYTDDMTVEEILGKIELTGNMDWMQPASAINDMTVADLSEFCTINQNISDPGARADFSALLWILDLAQPVYFGALGYMGNGDTPPAGFGFLAEADPLVRAPVPNTLPQLVIQP